MPAFHDHDLQASPLRCIICGQVSRLHARPHGLPYQRCAACGCVFRDFRTGPGYGESQGIYASTKPPAPDARSMKRADMGYAHMEDLMLRTGKDRSSRVLDVGCGPGNLLNFLSGRKWENLAGVEPNVPSDDPRIARCTLEILAQQAATRFDLIVYNQVIEHLPDPVAALKAAVSLLNPGGHIILTTPNLRTPDKWFRHQMARIGLARHPWGYLDAPKHVVLFTPHSLQALSRASGINQMEVGTWTRPLGLGNRLLGAVRNRLGFGAHCFGIFSLPGRTPE